MALLRDHLAPRLIGRDPAQIEAIWRDAAVRHPRHQPSAPSRAWRWPRSTPRCGTGAAAATASRCGWRPAAHRPRIPVYTTEGGWLHLSPDDLVRETLAAQAAGFRGAKVKVGKPHLSEDLARLRAVRDAVGDGFEIMVDANQCFTLSEALRRAPKYADLGIAWFEEPLPADDLAGHARLAAASAAADRGRRIALFTGAVRRLRAAGRGIDPAGRRGARRRHHALAQGGAPGRGVQPRRLPAFPDGAARVPVRGGAECGLGRIHPAARRHRQQPAGDRRRPCRRARCAGPGHRMGWDAIRERARTTELIH